MPYIFLGIGALFIVAGYQNTYKELGQILADEFTNKPNQPSFMYWALAVFLLGIVGYIPGARLYSRALIILVIVGMVFGEHSNMAGWFKKFNDALSSGSKTPVNPASGDVAYYDPASSGGRGSASSGGSGASASADGGAAGDVGKAGAALMAAGAIVEFIPVVGQIAGTAMMVAGGAMQAGAKIAQS